MRARTMRTAIGAMTVVLALGTAACGLDGGDDAGQASTSQTRSGTDTASNGGSAAGGGGGQADELAAADVDAANRQKAAVAPLPAGLGEAKVVKTASLDVEIAKGGFDAAFSKVATIAAAHGGFVASSSTSRASGEETSSQAAGSVVLRVPSAEFDATREDLVGLGKLRSQELEGDDVGGQLTDLDARLRNLRSQEEAMRLLMTKAGTIGETIEVQRQLSSVREEIERLAGEQARLTDAVTYSTLTLSLAEPGVAFDEPTDPSSIAEAFARAWDGAQSVIAGVILVLGYLLPIAILVALGWLAIRAFTPRKREPEVVSP